MHCTIRYIDCTKTQWWHNFFVFISFRFCNNSFLSFVACFVIIRHSMKTQWPFCTSPFPISFGFKLFQHFYWLIWRTPAFFLVLCLRREENEKKTVRSHIWKWLDHMSCFCVLCVWVFFFGCVFFVCIYSFI